MRIVVVGATGRAGTQLVQQALDAGHEVVAYVRRPEAVPARTGLTVVEGSVDDVAALVDVCSGADAVVSCLGPKPSLGFITGLDLMQRSVPAMVAAVRQADVPRFVLLSAFGVGDTAAKASWVARLVYRTVLRSVFSDKERSERALPGSGVNWAVLYSVTLHEAPAVGAAVVKSLDEVGRVPGMPRLTFADVAAELLELATTPHRSGRRLLITTRGGWTPA